MSFSRLLPIRKIFERLTGKDDVEWVAAREDIGQLTDYLKTRRLLIPRRPGRFLDASSYTPEDLLELMREEVEALSSDPFEPWVLDFDGTRRLPAFSSRKKMVTFSGAISKQLNRVFSLGCAEILLDDIIESIDVNFIDLNRFSRMSWEIGIDALGRGED